MTGSRKSQIASFICLALTGELTIAPVFAQSDAPTTIASAATSQIANANIPLPLAAGVQLSQEAVSMAAQLDLSDRIHCLTDLKQQMSAPSDRTSVNTLALRQDLGEAKQELMRAILKTNLEVDYVLAAIDGEQNDYSRLAASLSNSRDTAILVNTIVTQLTNGIFWSLAGVYTIVGIKKIEASNVDGISSMIAGFLPASLSLYAIYQAHGPKRPVPRHPNMLAPLFGSGTSDDGYYPGSVSKFMDSAPPDRSAGNTRKQALIEQWIKDKYIGKNGSISSDIKTQLAAGTIEKRRALTISLLQTRQSMLADVRVVVLQMKRGLVELMPLLER